MSNLSRRKFLVTAAGAAVGTTILHGCSSSETPETPEASAPTPEATPAPAGGEAPETNVVKLGFIALTDSAPLIIAKEKGLFDKYGMTGAEILKQASWPVTRDNIELGSGGGGIDGAHILTPMPYLMTLGAITKTKQPLPMYILARLNTNGQGISVAGEYSDLKIGVDSSPLKEVFAKAKAGGKELGSPKGIRMRCSDGQKAR